MSATPFYSDKHPYDIIFSYKMKEFKQTNYQNKYIKYDRINLF